MMRKRSGLRSRSVRRIAERETARMAIGGVDTGRGKRVEKRAEKGTQVRGLSTKVDLTFAVPGVLALGNGGRAVCIFVSAMVRVDGSPCAALAFLTSRPISSFWLCPPRTQPHAVRIDARCLFELLEPGLDPARRPSADAGMLSAHQHIHLTPPRTALGPVVGGYVPAAGLLATARARGDGPSVFDARCSVFGVRCSGSKSPGPALTSRCALAPLHNCEDGGGRCGDYLMTPAASRRRRGTSAGRYTRVPL
ncbi:hypothetical protein OH77DRAFT_839930 [Trametes cingulata]|nr:hypothetical protein OH77DRAFT_839930 [Trametes cingulata]